MINYRKHLKKVVVGTIVGAAAYGLGTSPLFQNHTCAWIWNGATMLQDPACTPGEVNPALTMDVLCSPGFSTKSVRDQTTTLSEKATTYAEYNAPHPHNNTGANQVCELDHLISLELGGADTLANIWPQCSATEPGWKGLGFRDKDKIENILHQEVCDKRITLDEAQNCIKTDWTRCAQK